MKLVKRDHIKFGHLNKKGRDRELKTTTKLIPGKSMKSLGRGGKIIRRAWNQDKIGRENRSQGQEILNGSMVKCGRGGIKQVGLLWRTRETLAFLFFPTAEGLAASEDLVLSVRGGIRFTWVAKGVGMIVLELAAKCSEEEAERSASFHTLMNLGKYHSMWKCKGRGHIL